jgi:predicted metalloendopeptidase
LRDWWTPADGEQFQQRAQLMVDQYSAFNPIDDLKLQGALGLGENIADLGGLGIAYDAYMRHRAKRRANETEHREGVRLFFLGFAEAECGHERPESARTSIMVDPHSPSVFRVNGPVSNLPAFYDAFGVNPKDKLFRAPAARARIW